MTTARASAKRMLGAGNSFYVLGLFDDELLQAYLKKTKQEIQQIVRNNCKNGTDGFLFLRPEVGLDFRWDFYNSDGSDAEMCGNAARCASSYYFARTGKKSCRFMTGAGEIIGMLNDQDDLITVQMTKIIGSEDKVVSGHQGYFLNTGVPHFVIETDPDANIAKKLREVTDFGPAGANITFVKVESANHIKAVTFERGVEGFTQACGTGAVAAAMYLQKKIGPQNKVFVEMPGGQLVVEGAKEQSQPLLTGPAVFDAEIQINLSGG